MIIYLSIHLGFYAFVTVVGTLAQLFMIFCSSKLSWTTFLSVTLAHMRYVARGTISHLAKPLDTLQSLQAELWLI